MTRENQKAPKEKQRHSATINDVAAMAGVSIATVSRVINGSTTVSELKTRRVKEAIATLSFIPHLAARVLATNKTQTIGLILPEISGDYFSPLLRGIEECLRGKSYDLLVQSTVATPGSNGSPALKLGQHNTDGLLVFAASLSEAEITRLHLNGFPMVLLHQSPPQGLPIPCITIENKAGVLKIMNHLLEVHGYKKIAFLAGPDTEEDSYWRALGYREALANHNIPYDPELIFAGHFDTSVAQASVLKMLKEGVTFDAIFTGDDDSAIGAITAIQQAGLRVPEDIAVVGFDDIHISQYLSPPLTTVRAPIEKVGFIAAQQLIRLIQQEPVESLELLPTELIVRRSCGCSAVEKGGERNNTEENARITLNQASLSLGSPNYNQIP